MIKARLVAGPAMMVLPVCDSSRKYASKSNGKGRSWSLAALVMIIVVRRKRRRLRLVMVVKAADLKVVASCLLLCSHVLGIEGPPDSQLIAMNVWVDSSFWSMAVEGQSIPRDGRSKSHRVLLDSQATNLRGAASARTRTEMMFESSSICEQLQSSKVPKN